MTQIAVGGCGLKSEIYTGPTGTGRYVPNIEDAVWDWTAGVFRVVDVNITTGLSTLVLHTFPTQSAHLKKIFFRCHSILLENRLDYM